MSRNTTSEASRQGIALVSVLAVTVVTVILAAIFSYMVISERRSTGAASVSSSSLQLADAASERARAIIVDEYKKSFLSSDKFVEKLGDVNDPLAVKLGNKGPVSATIGDSVARWSYDVPSAAPEGNKSSGGSTKTAAKWLDIYATAETGQGVQTVIRRITMGESDIFTLAMLSENTECMYCHLQVFGDVGSLGYFRPGHQGVGSAGGGGGSNINGDLFVAPPATPNPDDRENNNITDDATNLNGASKRINGANFNGEIFDNYEGSRFPLNSNNKPEFPPINREVAANSAGGTLSGGVLRRLVGEDGEYNPTSTENNTLSSSNTGNAVLVGTKANPIVLEGDVYFSGDVVIKGYVQGKGGIYSGRNVYVAGDIKYVNEPEDCRDPEVNKDYNDDPDQCAQANLGDADELRIAARGNVVLGDYTETEGLPTDGNSQGKGEAKKSYQALNAADYFREQFGFNNPDDGETLPNRYYDTATGDELTLEDGEYKNVDGETVTTVTSVSAYDAYDYSMRPGKVTNTGFDSWLSDDAYQELLGKQQRAYDSWRQNVDRAELTRIYNDAGAGDAGVTAIKALLGPGAENVSDESIRRLACIGGGGCGNPDSFNLFNDSDPPEPIGQVTWSTDKGQPILLAILDEAALYDAQVNRVDAFLYSNQRIAGKTFNAPLAINGGLVSKELGVLAPGVERQWWQNDRYQFLSDDLLSEDNNCNRLDSSISNKLRGGDSGTIPAFGAENYYNLGLSTDTSGSITKDYSSDCAFTVNYDYRMRNGGLGFNLVAQDVGRTVSWRVGSTSEDRVQAP